MFFVEKRRLDRRGVLDDATGSVDAVVAAVKFSSNIDLSRIPAVFSFQLFVT